MGYLKVLLIELIAVCSILSVVNAKFINCYYGTWAHYREGDGAFKVDHINPNLCTHISYSFYGIEEGSGKIQTLDSWLTEDDGVGQVAAIMKLKQVNPKLKIILVVGGWTESGSNKYSKMAASPVMRKNFIESAKNLITKHGFDGLDLDWEYPVVRAGGPADKQNFVTLLSEVHQAMKSMGKEFGIAVGAGEGTASQAYDIPGIAKNVDFINVMSYDFAGFYNGVVGFNAPLEGQGQNNVKSAIKYWMSKGAPASKLVLGLPFYGRTFKLADAQKYTEGSPVVDGLEAGPITHEKGYFSYAEICKIKDNYSYEWSSEHSVPFLHKGTAFISYDDIKSIELKIDFGASLNLGGVMIWSIESDDFHGKCGDGKFPLLNAVNKRLQNPNGASMAGIANRQSNMPAKKPEHHITPAPAPAPSAASSQTESSDSCKNGVYPHPTDCKMFIHCSNNIKYEKFCPETTLFDAAARTCNHAELVNCNL